MQFSKLEGGLACELRQAYCAVQKRIGLDSSACSRKHLPMVLSLFFYYELIKVLKAISAAEYLGLSNQPNQAE